MNAGKRHLLAPARGRVLFASMSVIALLALACFPLLAQAECVSSSCIQYTESIPKAEGESPQPHKKHPAVAKAADNGGASAPDGKTGAKGSDGEKGESSEEESSSKEGGGVAAGNGGGTGQGNPAGSGNGGAQNPSHTSAQSTTAKPVSQSSDSGSSPLVPILIAIAALAAISVAAVMIRQRRQRRGPAASPSPEAR